MPSLRDCTAGRRAARKPACGAGPELACAAAADALEEEDDNHQREAQEYNRGDDVGDALQTGIPRVVGPAHGLEHRPHAVREVEPQGGKPQQIDNHVVPLREGVGDERSTVGGAEAQRVLVLAHDFHELHLRPEVEQVEQQSAQDNPSQQQHVLRSPLYALLLDRDGVTLVASCTVVVHREDEGVDEVNQYACGQNDGAGQCIPVGAQERANRVVTLGRDNRHDVHGHVEEDKEHEETACHAHY